MENGKFHPHTQYKGVRKSRDQQVKEHGIRLARRSNRVRLNDPVHDLEGNVTTINELDKQGKITYEFIPKFHSGTRNDPSPKYFATFKGTMSSFEIGKTAYESKTGKTVEIAERKARDGMPLPILETGLDDIFDDVRQTDPEFVKRYGDDKIDDSKLTKAVGDNIIYILKREKRLKNDEHISVGNINFREETEDESGHYQYDYSIWKNNPRKLINKGGTAYGMISNGTLIDMNLELFNTDKMP